MVTSNEIKIIDERRGQGLENTLQLQFHLFFSSSPQRSSQLWANHSIRSTFDSTNCCWGCSFLARAKLFSLFSNWQCRFEFFQLFLFFFFTPARGSSLWPNRPAIPVQRYCGCSERKSEKFNRSLSPLATPHELNGKTCSTLKRYCFEFQTHLRRVRLDVCRYFLHTFIHGCYVAWAVLFLLPVQNSDSISKMLSEVEKSSSYKSISREIFDRLLCDGQTSQHRKSHTTPRHKLDKTSIEESF